MAEGEVTMGILIGLLIVVCAVALVMFGITGLRLQGLLVQVPKEKLKAAGLNLEIISLNMAPNYLSKMKQLGHSEIARLARQMQIETAIFIGIFSILLLYAIVIVL